MVEPYSMLVAGFAGTLRCRVGAEPPGSNSLSNVGLISCASQRNGADSPAFLLHRAAMRREKAISGLAFPLGSRRSLKPHRLLARVRNTGWLDVGPDLLGLLAVDRRSPIPAAVPARVAQAAAQRRHLARRLGGLSGLRPTDRWNQAIWMLLACLPLGPFVTSNVTR